MERKIRKKTEHSKKRYSYKEAILQIAFCVLFDVRETAMDGTT